MWNKTLCLLTAGWLSVMINLVVAEPAEQLDRCESPPVQANKHHFASDTGKPYYLAFLRGVMEQVADEQMVPAPDVSPGNYVFCKPGAYYLIYFTTAEPTRLKLAGYQPYKADGIDTDKMKVTSLGNIYPGESDFTPPNADYLLRLIRYQPNEVLRPDVTISASPDEGIAPLKVNFRSSTESDMVRYLWKFGNGTTSTEANPTYMYDKPGFYTVSLRVISQMDRETTRFLHVMVDADPGTPIVRVGVRQGDTPPVSLHGPIERNRDGVYNLSEGKPWKCIRVGDKPLMELEELHSFTIMGWLNPASLNVGSSGSRIAFNLNNNCDSGFDLVCLSDGRLRLSINELSDHVLNVSSPGKLWANRWVFFAITYDGTKAKDNVCWYFGDENSPAQLDRTVSYARGPTGRGSGMLTIGNCNKTIQRQGQDRQFRGKLRRIMIFGSRFGPLGALPLTGIRKHQRIPSLKPDSSSSSSSSSVSRMADDKSS
ncbi:MAG: PKD domain-containing protein [Sedimentisphaerales bacterium]|nr:PKD domain-containing protein [Sedimentisphaerales bacterium]